jgi:hypothetical protein
VYAPLGKLGGNPPLSQKGLEYSVALFEFMHKNESHRDKTANYDDSIVDLHVFLINKEIIPKLRIISSTLQRSVQTVQFFDENGYDTSYVK